MTFPRPTICNRGMDRGRRGATAFGVICPKKGKGSGLVLPGDTDALRQRLTEIGLAVDDGARAILILDQAGSIRQDGAARRN
ncbi:hypothetical protein [Ensifer soli]|uniref:hypothetical protein n=1 Tax=Ciceribacter sp. sgz301302 TaxID=3342379 RepID=UPI0035BA6A00